MPSDEFQQLLNDLDLDNKRIALLKGGLPSRLVEPLVLDQWVPPLYVLRDWNGGSSAVKRAILEYGLPVYALVQDPDSEKGFKLEWICDPWTHVEEMSKPLAERSRPFLSCFHIEDLTFVEKLHPEVSERSELLWLTVPEVCERWGKNDYQLECLMREHDYPLHRLVRHREVKMIHWPRFGPAPEDLFYLGNVFLIEDKHKLVGKKQQELDARHRSDVAKMVSQLGQKLWRPNEMAAFLKETLWGEPYDKRTILKQLYEDKSIPLNRKKGRSRKDDT